MNDIIVTVDSVTYAIKLRRLLSRAGIRSKLVKIEDTVTNKGCAHAVSISYNDFYNAVSIMKKYGFPYSLYQPKIK